MMKFLLAWDDGIIEVDENSNRADRTESRDIFQTFSLERKPIGRNFALAYRQNNFIAGGESA
jgi:hypothetical protein